MPQRQRSACYLTFAVDLASHDVADVRALFPLTRTVTYLPRWVRVSVKVLLVAPLILVQFDGAEVRTPVTALLQAYH
jgi:hypothetical protein